MDPLDYLVEDCWLHLFKFLSAEDKQAVCDTCETFHAMLQPEKTKWGFELILPHLSKHLTRRGGWSLIQLNEQLRFDLQFRLVCKSWRAIFDKLCATNRYHYVMMSYSTIRRNYDFVNVTNLEKFLNFFKDYQGNPFIGRRVTIYATSAGDENQSIEKEPEANDEGSATVNEMEEGSDEDEDYEEDEEEEDYEEDEEVDPQEEQRWRAEYERRQQQEKRERSLKNRQLVMELVLKYGKEIEHLTLNGICRSDNRFSPCSPLDACKFLQFVLCNTPNLQTLELNLRPYHNEPEECTLQTALAEYSELNPLPRIPTLRKLKLQDNNPMMEPLLLEAYGEHLQVLQTNNSLKIPLTVWSNMKCLKKLTLHRSDFANNEKILQALHSPLESLFIYETYQRRRSRDSGQFLMDKFLLAVQHLPLKKIEFQPASYIVKESGPFPADFPKHGTIKELSIPNASDVSLKFLPFLPQLKNLRIRRIDIHFKTLFAQRV